MGQWSKKLDQAQALIQEVWKEAHDQGMSILKGRGVSPEASKLDYPVWLEDSSGVVFDDNFMSELTEVADELDSGNFDDAVNELIDNIEGE